MFGNQEYLYQHLPSRFRREDRDLFLKRYLQWFGATLDDYDEKFDAFFESIDPATASEEFIEFWLDNLFGWSWFPVWFTLEDKRRLYANFGRHLARRGTRRGIELWLADFHIKARAFTRPTFIGEFVWGEPDFFVADPLLILVKILYAEQQALTEMASVGEAVWGESFYVDVVPLFIQSEVSDLLGYVQPHAQEILFVQTAPGTPPPVLSFYTTMNAKLLRALDVPTASANDLPEFLRFVATIIFDLNRSNSLNGYSGSYAPLRTLDFNFAQLADGMNFARTLVDDYNARRSFDDYVIANFVPLRTIDPLFSQLEDGLRAIMTVAADLGATASVIVPPDVTAPVISIVSPTEGATLSEAINAFIVTATDDTAVRGIRAYLDDVLIGSEDTSPPYSGNIDATTLAEGEHTLTAVGYDLAGNASEEATRTFNVPPAPLWLSERIFDLEADGIVGADNSLVGTTPSSVDPDNYSAIDVPGREGTLHKNLDLFNGHDAVYYGAGKGAVIPPLPEGLTSLSIGFVAAQDAPDSTRIISANLNWLISLTRGGLQFYTGSVVSGLSPSPISANSAHVALAEITPDGAAFYVDGVLIASASGSFAIPAQLFLGWSVGGFGEQANAYLARTIGWTSLSSAARDQWFAAMKSKFGTP